MTELVIFAKEIGRDDDDRSFFIEFSSETPAGLSAVRPINIKIAEGLSIGSPVVVMDFVDGNGDFINHNKLDPSAIYFLRIGKHSGDFVQMELKIAKIIMANGSGGESRDVQFSVHFIQKNWDKMFGGTHQKSWGDVLLSDVVSDIAESCGFENIDVSLTDGFYESVIQPQWSNLSMLKWIKNRATPPTKEKSHFEFGVTTDGKFFFKSLSDILSENKRQIDNSELITLVMGGDELNAASRKLAIEENRDAPTFFVHYQGNERFMDGIINGTGGIKTSHFDFETGEYTTDDIFLSETSIVQMSDWCAIKEEFEGTTFLSHHGRDTAGQDKDTIRMSNVINSLQQFDVVMTGAPMIHIGTIIELIIPITPNVSADGASSIMPIAEYYSGFYLVSAANHSVNMEQGLSTTMLSLARTGSDGKDLEGYVKTKRGKFI